MGIREIVRAAFLDRDGVINGNVLNPATGQYESPHRPEDFDLITGALSALARLQGAGYRLFLISNQPSFAKGKTSMEAIQTIHARLETALAAAHIAFDAFYYCYHHPKGIVPAYSGPCDCRKPSPFFLQKAESEFGISLRDSWMVGDRVTDIECGRAAGARTIRVADVHAPPHRKDEIAADFNVSDLQEAVAVILREDRFGF